MKVLFFYSGLGSINLIKNLCFFLEKEKNIQTNYFGIDTFVTKKKKTFNYYTLRVIAFILFKPIFKVKLIKYFPRVIYFLIAKNYDIIDIHFFQPDYFNLIKILNKNKKKIKITIWGSDFYRVSDNLRVLQGVYYSNYIDVIQVAHKQMKDDFLSIYPSLENKVIVNNFGVSNFSILDNILKNKSKDSLKKELKIRYPNKKIVTIGYNGIEQQNHLHIISAMSNLPPKVKDDLYIIIPMSYGGIIEYRNKVKKAIESSNIDYLLLTEYMSIENVLEYRVVTDLTINIQTTDAFSASLQESLYSGSILLVASWLPYSILEENNVYFLKTDVKDLQEKIHSIIDNIGYHKEQCKNNLKKMDKISNWKFVIKKWEKIYLDMGDE